LEYSRGGMKTKRHHTELHYSLPGYRERGDRPAFGCLPIATLKVQRRQVAGSAQFVQRGGYL